jgi:hypothetical protein
VTGQERHRIRRLIDQHQRERLDAYRRAHRDVLCSGCGHHLTENTPGCTNCYDRSRRERRAQQDRLRRSRR